MPPGFKVHHEGRVVLGELHHVLLDELAHLAMDHYGMAAWHHYHHYDRGDSITVITLTCQDVIMTWHGCTANRIAFHYGMAG